MSNSHIRNLPIPYFSQRENIHEWKEREPAKIKDESGLEIDNPNAGEITLIDGKPKRTQKMASISCNITCVAMILHYYGITSNFPDDMMEKVFDYEIYRDLFFELSDGLDNPYDLLIYPENLLRIAKEIYHVEASSFVSYVYNVTNLQERISEGIPR